MGVLLEKVNEICGPTQSLVDQGVLPWDPSWQFNIRGDIWLAQQKEKEKQTKSGLRRSLQSRESQRMTAASSQVFMPCVSASMFMSFILAAFFLARSGHGIRVQPLL